jgi:hypothetical protein
MLSILIPTYNYDVSNLVETLIVQSEEIELKYEIIVADDYSSETIIDNTLLKNNVFVKHNKLNIGLAKTRNYLAESSKYKWLLFLDADVLPKRIDFIKNYIKNISETNKVIYGGLDYMNNNSDKLRYRYGTKREAISICKRNKKPNNFHCSNFLIEKETFMDIKFDSSISSYGHEDTLFAYKTYKKRIFIKHIENSVYHLGIDSNNIFIDKTKEAINSLVLLEKASKLPLNLTLIQKIFLELKKYKFLILFYKISSLSMKYIIKNLNSKTPSVFLFDIYRLNYYCHLKLK